MARNHKPKQKTIRGSVFDLLYKIADPNNRFTKIEVYIRMHRQKDDGWQLLGSITGAELRNNRDWFNHVIDEVFNG